MNSSLRKKNKHQWMQRYEMLCRFVNREGHALVPSAHQEGSVALGAWVSTQRRLFRRQKLDNNRQQLLEKLGGWEWSPYEAAWNAAFARLKKYIRREGHAALPRRHTEEGFDLGYWCSKQRRYNRDGKLSQKHFELLDKLPGWQWEPHEEMWDFAVRILEGYIEREGDALVPKEYIESGFHLGNWVSNVRKSYRSGNLPEESIRHLEKIRGWQWFPMSHRWESFYKLLLCYAEQNGHADIPLDYVVKGNLLGKWVGNQRRSFQKGTMSLEHRELLERLPGWHWAVHEESWDDKYQILVRYVSREDTLSMPRGYKEKGVALQKWTVRQRELYRSGQLSVRCQQLLEKIPDWQWDPFDEKWEENFNLLLSYAAREGHASVPQKYVCGEKRLGNWVNAQRKLFRQGKLSRDRRTRLEKVPGWVWALRNSQWERCYRLLTQYAARENKVLVPKKHKEDGIALGDWVVRQRSLYWRNSLSKEHVEQLEQFVGWTWFERKQSNRTELLPLDDNRLAQETWKILFGLGAVKKEWAHRYILRVLVDIGIFSEDVLDAKGKHDFVVADALYAAQKCGFIDEPKKDFIRAILTEQEDYIPDDWRMCLFQVIHEKSMNKNDAIRQTVKWAKTNLGLQLDCLTDKSSIWKRISEVIDAAVANNALKWTTSNGSEYLRISD
jgi:hypothetical protein